MAENKDIKAWRTTDRGKHYPILKGETPEEAIDRTFKTGGVKEYRQNTSYNEILATDKAKDAQKKIPQLERQESETRRIWQIQENTGLSYAESEKAYNAIKHYTRAGFRAIRDGRAPEEERIIEDFIERHPKYDGRVWRGIAVDDKGFLDNLIAKKETGELIDMAGISSWADNEAVAQDFAVNRPGKYKILFETDNKSGVGIDHLSEWYGEGEVLHSGKTRYKVNEIIEQDGKYYIKIEEV